MYKRILVALENKRGDTELIAHVAKLAELLGSEILLLHVAEGFAARNFKQLSLAESEEMQQDRAYLEAAESNLVKQGIKASHHLALGNPPDEIVETADSRHCDLIAMGGHGHRLIGDVIHGSTISPVRHKTTRPVLIVRVKS